MKKKYYFLLVGILIVTSQLSYGQNLNGRVSSAVYAFERASSLDQSDMFIRGYESLTLNINKGNYSLRTRLNFETNFGNALKNDPKFRLYNLYFEARKVFDVATLKFGRQPIFNNVGSGLFDGANIKVKLKDYIFQGYFGGNVPYYQKAEVTNDWSSNRIFGGKFLYKGIKNLNLGLSYVDKNYKPINYYAERLDANYDVIKVLVEQNSNQYRYASFNAGYFGLLDVNTKLDFDLNFMKMSKIELNTSYNKFKKVNFNLYYNYRNPQIRYNSIFAVFNYANTHEIEAGIDYKINKKFTIIGKFGDVIYDDDNSQRLTLGLNTIWGSASFRKTFGYAGELSSLSVYTSKSFMNGLITPSIGLAYTNYKLSENEESNDIISGIAGINLRPWRTLSFDLQGQYSDNSIYKNDVRLFFKINYWFNTNLDLL